VFLQRDLPKAEVYQWRNAQDNQTIEGILHYPPNQFRATNLPLLILIHGGPFMASVNEFQVGWYQWAPLAATHGWLVLEPNYLGFSGYGDQFVSDILGQPVSQPWRDILAAVNHLIKEGAVDSNQLAVSGYSYGGFVTNWLFTQTTRFNAALSDAGAAEHVSAWGVMHLPGFYQLLFGTLP
jgi:dipeptidyl aminopeptidase/acylaminoacyl peptidase